jgi:hypothetical protein
LGQYWRAFNIDKKECINPWELDGVAKLWEEFHNCEQPRALLLLLAAMPSARGGGDFGAEYICNSDGFQVIGRWAGDRVVFLGDYAQNGDIVACNPDFRGVIMLGEQYWWSNIEGKTDKKEETVPVKWKFKDISKEVKKLLDKLNPKEE